MPQRRDTNEQMAQLYDVILKCRTREDCAALFADLCTHKEVENMAQRIAAAKLLLKGETYNRVIEATGIASATLARVSNCVKYGEGYQKFLQP